jgi:F-type H+-transporting ATPase subunit gamma
MVSANKLRKAQVALKRADQYYDKLMRIMRGLVDAGADLGQISVCKPRKEVKNVLVIVVSSDRGLCGGFNNNLNKTVLRWIAERDPEVKTSVYTCGKKSTIYLKNRTNIGNTYDGVTVKPRFSDAQKIASDLQSAFLKARADEVYIAYNRFKSVISQEPVIEKFLPMLPERFKRLEGDVSHQDILLDSSYDDIFKEAVPQLMSLTVFRAMMISSVGEHAARMTAMENSKNNAENLIDTLTLLRNRARQAAITNELSEIISGAESLN